MVLLLFTKRENSRVNSSTHSYTSLATNRKKIYLGRGKLVESASLWPRIPIAWVLKADWVSLTEFGERPEEVDSSVCSILGSNEGGIQFLIGFQVNATLLSILLLKSKKIKLANPQLKHKLWVYPRNHKTGKFFND